jgi:hypothetical protein
MHSWQQVHAFYVVLQAIVVFLAIAFLPKLLVIFVIVVAFL